MAADGRTIDRLARRPRPPPRPLPRHRPQPTRSRSPRRRAQSASPHQPRPRPRRPPLDPHLINPGRTQPRSHRLIDLRDLRPTDTDPTTELAVGHIQPALKSPPAPTCPLFNSLLAPRWLAGYASDGTE